MISCQKEPALLTDLIKDGDKIVLGVSGGPDSMCMLDMMRELKEEKNINFEIYVAHINHMIREEAIDDEKYVQNYCLKHNIEFFVKRADVQKIANDKKIGTEEAGRKVRYDFFEEVLQKTGSNKIAIAHNKNDKIETIIMHLLRGSGLSGLKGIEPIRDNKYIRPLIECERREIEQYCEDKKLQADDDDPFKSSFGILYSFAKRVINMIRTNQLDTSDVSAMKCMAKSLGEIRDKFMIEKQKVMIVTKM